MTDFLKRARLIRLILGVLMSPVLMAVSYILINTWHGSFQMALAIGWLTLSRAFQTAGIQLFVYSLLMEFLVVPKLKNIHAVAVVSGLLLLLTVISTFLTFFGPSLTPFENDRLTPVLGFVIGNLLGYGLKLSAQNQRKRG